VLRQLLSDIHCPQSEPTVIYEDNQSCICLSKNPVVSNRSKHIDIRYRVRSTEHQLADLLTKPLLTTKVEAEERSPGILTKISISLSGGVGIHAQLDT
jgi:hypothetical protein